MWEVYTYKFCKWWQEQSLDQLEIVLDQTKILQKYKIQDMGFHAWKTRFEINIQIANAFGFICLFLINYESRYFCLFLWVTLQN